jgi:hypothetical protein
VSEFRKRREFHLGGTAVGSLFVLSIAIETLATWFTADMCGARALNLGMGGRTTADKSNAIDAISTSVPHCSFLFFILGLQRFDRTLNAPEFAFLFYPARSKAL